jgi:pyrimidine-nucleoside phosphorylase
MRAVDIIRTKRDGGRLRPEEIAWFVAGAASGRIPDYQSVALLMAVTLRGMDDEEIAALTRAMVESGERLDLSGLPGPTVDKHSTGGVGDKTSLVLAPLVAACGGIVPMMSGRGLGHTGGTLDKLEAIDGLRTSLTASAFKSQLERIGCAIVGQSASIAPADRVFYALRDVTATVDSVPLIAASIMSKKIAEGAGALVLDVKTGRGAFMRREDEAGHLAGRMVAIGRSAGVRTEALITAMDVPLGRAVGNALEVAESLDVLRGNGAEDLSALCRALAVRMLTLAGLAATDEEAGRRVDEAIASGRALERFARMVDAQGGDPAVVDDPARLPAAPGRATVVAPRAGYLTGLDAELVGHAAVALGAGRSRAEDRVDPAVGLTLHAKPGDPLALGQPIVEIHYRDEASRDRAQALVASAIAVGDEPPAPGRLVRRRLS